VPKKTKSTEAKNQETAEPGALSAEPKSGKGTRSRRLPATSRVRKTISRKIAVEPAKQPDSSSKSQQTNTEPSDDAVRLRAYFIFERRRRFALPGNAESDWIEAKRQLLAEV
jgi:Protein of unknown function (DUF2934)